MCDENIRPENRPEKVKYKTVKRYNIPNHTHELTFSCFKRQPLLRDERICRYLADAISRTKENLHYGLLAYVFMPEHVHLIIIPEREVYSVSEFLTSAKQSVARKQLIYLRKNDPDGLKRLETGQKHIPYRFWMDGDGYNRNIVSKDALTNMIDYIHYNPVKKGYVKSSVDWKWSSAGFWIAGNDGEIQIDKHLFPA